MVDLGRENGQFSSLQTRWSYTYKPTSYLLTQEKKNCVELAFFMGGLKTKKINFLDFHFTGIIKF